MALGRPWVRAGDDPRALLNAAVERAPPRGPALDYDAKLAVLDHVVGERVGEWFDRVVDVGRERRSPPLVPVRYELKGHPVAQLSSRSTS
jgi:hypothetical protein